MEELIQTVNQLSARVDTITVFVRLNFIVLTMIFILWLMKQWKIW